MTCRELWHLHRLALLVRGILQKAGEHAGVGLDEDWAGGALQKDEDD